MFGRPGKACVFEHGTKRRGSELRHILDCFSYCLFLKNFMF
jgi:hypothetical protein